VKVENVNDETANEDPGGGWEYDTWNCGENGFVEAIHVQTFAYDKYKVSVKLQSIT